MTGEEFIVAIIAILAGSLVLIVGISQITGLIKAWINRGGKGHFSDEDFSRLAKAFTQHKKDMEKRVQNLEAIIAGEDEASSYPQVEVPEEENILMNDLEQKRKVR